MRNALRCPVAVLGDGVSGRAAARLAKSLGASVDVFSEDGIAFGRFEAERARVVITSPGFRKDHPWLTLAQESRCALIGELDFASLSWPGEVIAVTGSNGKTTVTELLTQVLRKAGQNAVATGNVGYPLSAAVLERPSSSSVAVCEVSSFQAETLQYLRPSAVLWTSFSEDHLDRHDDLREYFEAKANLARRTSPERLFLGSGVADAARTMGRHYLRGVDWQKEKNYCHAAPSDSAFSLGPQRDNYLLLQAFCRHRGLPENLLARVASEFVLPEHRLYKPIKVDDVSFWNDSKATNFGAAVAACRHFSRKALWIGGGQAKGGNLESFCNAIKKMVRRVYLIGSSASDMLPFFSSSRIPANIFPSLSGNPAGT